MHAHAGYETGAHDTFFVCPLLTWSAAVCTNATDAAATDGTALRAQIFGRDDGRFVQQQRFAFALAGTDAIAFAISITDFRFGVHGAIIHRCAGYLQ